MKRFNDYINESLTDQMVGKSDDEVQQKMKGLKPSEKIDYIKRYKLSDDLYPSDEEIKNELKSLDPLDQISYIKYYKLSKDLFPSGDEIKIGVIKFVLELYTDSKKNGLSDICEILFNNDYSYEGLNIEDDNRERQEKTKGYDVVWFKYDKPEHYISFTNETKLSEIKDRLNLYKKRYNL